MSATLTATRGIYFYQGVDQTFYLQCWLRQKCQTPLILSSGVAGLANCRLVEQRYSTPGIVVFLPFRLEKELMFPFL